MASGVTVPATAGPASTTLPTPIGELTIVCSATGVVATVFDDVEEANHLLDSIVRTLDDVPDHAVDGEPARTSDGEAGGKLARAARCDVEAYLDGDDRPFSVPPDLALVARRFDRLVLEVVATIPYGVLWTYGDVAGMAGSPKAARAAGNALAGCPIELFVPCHRVVHASGTIRGYGRHEDRKRWLLRHEGAID